MNSLWDQDWCLYSYGHLSIQFRNLKTFVFLHAFYTHSCVCLHTCVYLTSYRQWEFTTSNSSSSPLQSHQTADMHNELYSLFIFRRSMNSCWITPTRSPSTFMSSNAVYKIWRLFFGKRTSHVYRLIKLPPTNALDQLTCQHSRELTNTILFIFKNNVTKRLAPIVTSWKPFYRVTIFYFYDCCYV